MKTRRIYGSSTLIFRECRWQNLTTSAVYTDSPLDSTVILLLPLLLGKKCAHILTYCRIQMSQLCHFRINSFSNSCRAMKKYIFTVSNLTEMYCFLHLWHLAAAKSLLLFIYTWMSKVWSMHTKDGLWHCHSKLVWPTFKFRDWSSHVISLQMWSFTNLVNDFLKCHSLLYSLSCTSINRPCRCIWYLLV